MAEKSLISWTHGTWNPWVGCDKIAPECAHCYINREIRKQSDWQTDGSPRKPWGELYLTKTWGDPYKWQNEINQHDMLIRRLPSNEPFGKCRRVFTCSLSDFFHSQVDKRTIITSALKGYENKVVVQNTLAQHRRPHTNMSPNSSEGQSPLWRDCAWQVIKDTPNLIYLILTKRPDLIPARLPKDWGEGYPNVWLGTSVGCRMTLSKIDSLRKVPVHPKAVRFLSCEPLLENIAWDIDLSGIGWVIVGGESGTNPEYRWNPDGDWRKELQNDRGRRTMEVGWAKDLRMKCAAKGIPFWFKQITGAKSGMGEDALGEVVHEVPAPPYGQWAVSEESKLVVLA